MSKKNGKNPEIPLSLVQRTALDAGINGVMQAQKVVEARRETLNAIFKELGLDPQARYKRTDAGLVETAAPAGQ